ncbi:hypothetical protein [Anaerosolibacter sp.]|uniref:hypothetical protein n=1 Tax=Anaerosolibacter sp. TaxID=1872527 RepID=UPI0039F0A7D0
MNRMIGKKAVIEVELWQEIIESGIAKNYIEEYLSTLGGENCGSGLYKGKDWEIQIQEKSDRCFGKLCLPVNLVIFRGEKSICQQLVDRFRLTFLSAGG